MRFTRTEQKGIAALLLLLLVLVIVRFSMHFWVNSPEIDSKEVVLASQTVKEQQHLTIKKALPNARLNLNIADSLQLVSLPGIGKGLAHRILERRRELGRFGNMDEVLEVYKFRKDTRKMLLEHTFVE